MAPKKPAQKPSGGAGAEGPKQSAPAPAPKPAAAPAPPPSRPTAAPAKTTQPPKPAGVTLNYAKNVESRVNSLLAQGNIEAAKLQATNIKGGGSGVANTLGRINTAINAASSFAEKVRQSQAATTTEDPGNEIPIIPQVPVVPEIDPFAYEREMFALQEQRRKQNAIATLRGLMTEFGLQSLMAKVEQYVVDGYDADAIMVLIRTTPEYNQRFPAMAALAKKGRAISEAAYIEYERAASGLERQYGLPAGMLMGNVTELLEKEVSATELNDRVLMAAGSAYQMPQEFRTQFKEYYGIDTGGLTAYFLDPDVATPLLQRQFGAAMIGSEAARQNVGVQVGLAEELQTLGLTQEQARTGFGEVAGRRSLTEGRGDVVTQEQLVRGGLMNNEAALQQIERAAGARVGRFQESAGFVAAERGVPGLAASTTT